MAGEPTAARLTVGASAVRPVAFRGLGLTAAPASPERFASEAAARAGRLFPEGANEATGRENITLDATSRSLRIQLAADSGNVLEVPLLRAEVAHAEGTAGRHFVAVVPHRSAGHSTEGASDGAAALGAWLLVLEGDNAALSEVLEALSAFGAIRSGLQKAFALTSQELGAGGCATVHLGRRRSAAGGAAASVALKLARAPATPSDAALLAELPLLATAQGHDNVVRLLGLFRARDVLGRIGEQWALVLDLHGGGDLQIWVSKRGPQSEDFAARTQCGVLAALAHVHARGIVHRDVKSENILLDQAGQKGVLTDFGIAAFMQDAAAMTQRSGSVGYMAPEVLRNEAYDSKVDVFGMGVTLYYTLSGKLPFQGQDRAQVLRRNMRAQVNLESTRHLQRCSSGAKKFMLQLLKASPEARPAAAEAVAHTWLQKCAKEAEQSQQQPPAQGQQQEGPLGPGARFGPSPPPPRAPGQPGPATRWWSHFAAKSSTLGELPPPPSTSSTGQGGDESSRCTVVASRGGIKAFERLRSSLAAVSEGALPNLYGQAAPPSRQPMAPAGTACSGQRTPAARASSEAAGRRTAGASAGTQPPMFAQLEDEEELAHLTPPLTPRAGEQAGKAAPGRNRRFRRLTGPGAVVHDTDTKGEETEEWASVMCGAAATSTTTATPRYSLRGSTGDVRGAHGRPDDLFSDYLGIGSADELPRMPPTLEGAEEPGAAQPAAGEDAPLVTVRPAKPVGPMLATQGRDAGKFKGIPLLSILADVQHGAGGRVSSLDLAPGSGGAAAVGPTGRPDEQSRARRYTERAQGQGASAGDALPDCRNSERPSLRSVLGAVFRRR